MIISLSKNLQKTFNINLNKNILKKEVQQFIEDHINTDINKLLLKPSPFQNISVTELVNQIICKTKSKTIKFFPALAAFFMNVAATG